ncbi:hypothetical protein D3C85_598980 [compost metagenome]
MVDPGLATHRGVDLGQQGGGHLDEVHAALVAGRGEAGHVADNAAAEGDDSGTPVVARPQQGIEDQLQGFPVLVGFAIRQHHRQHRVTLEGLGQLLQIEGRHGLVGDDGHLTAGDVRGEKFGLRQKARTDMDGIATLAKIDLKCPHGAPDIKRAKG